MVKKETNWQEFIRRQRYPDSEPRFLTEKEQLRQRLRDEVKLFLDSGGEVREVDHTSNRAFQNKEIQSRYKNQKARNKAEWALAREAEIRKRSEN